jgi:phospholipase C
MSEPIRISRRAVLGGALVGGAAFGLPAGSASAAAARNAQVRAAKKVKKPGPGTLPYPDLAPGTDTIPEIQHIVAVMMENHTYDSVLGMLDVPTVPNAGFTLDASGQPTNSNPWPKSQTVFPAPGKDAVLTAFPMATACQLDNGKSGSLGTAYPWNTWPASHTSYAGGKMDGFVKSQSGPVSMGYYDSDFLPFVNSLAATFPVCTNFFSSVLSQTYPNRRYFMAGTSNGLLNDTLKTDVPANGTIFEALNTYGISWRNYYVDGSLPSILIWTYLSGKEYTDIYNTTNVPTMDQFFSDAANSHLPAYSMIDPNFGDSSEEDPQDVQNGDYFLSTIINAVMASPQWENTLLVWTYDEGGGYYDHVPPPKAVKPDDVPPDFSPGDPGGAVFDRYGFRVPSGIVSPYAIPGYASTVTHDFTSILKLIETKWNLPALTYRDAQADDLLDSIDLTSEPAFLTPPTLATAINPGDPATTDEACQAEEPIQIPPPGYVTTR